jgi:hypothetical protein
VRDRLERGIGGGTAEHLQPLVPPAPGLQQGRQLDAVGVRRQADHDLEREASATVIVGRAEAVEGEQQARRLGHRGAHARLST